LVLSNREMWRNQRTSCEPAFHKTYLRNFFGIMLDCTNDTFKIIDRHLDQQLDVSELMSLFALEVLGKLN
jgi:cytochrome P450